jgi:uncharacterized protein (UPF0332 family)
MLKKETMGYLEKAEERRITAEYSMNAHRYNMVISDTYYYLFNLCRAVMYEELSDTTVKHKTLVGNFNKMMIHERGIFPNELGKILNTLSRERNACDYEASYHVDKELAQYLYKNAILYGDMLKEYIDHD